MKAAGVACSVVDMFRVVIAVQGIDIIADKHMIAFRVQIAAMVAVT